jgi:glycosyltransferase involved in cell wall biosynthesis
VYREHTVSLIIPCFNEETGIARVLDKAPSFIDEVIVVDNGSTDNTEYIARVAGADVIVEHRRGYGRAYQTGFKRASGDIIVTSDGDGTYPVEDVAQVIDYLLDTPLDFVSGSRFPLRDKRSMSYRNFVGNAFITFLVVLLFHERITDALTGMWVFRRRCLKEITLISNTWDFSEEIKIEAIRNPNIRFGEYPLVYKERHGQTKMFPWTVALSNVIFLFYKRLLTLPRSKPAPAEEKSEVLIGKG